jgi:prepilin-type N-terminal cleavage/methylation domain-containing protein
LRFRANRTWPEQSSAAPGFSLIEVLVALTIVGLGLTAAAGMLGVGMRGHDTARDVAAASAFAEDLIAQTGVTDRLQAGETHGSFAGRFEWARSIAPYTDRPSATDRVLNGDAAPPLYRVTVAVAWEDGRRRQRITLSTLRLGSASP